MAVIFPLWVVSGVLVLVGMYLQLGVGVGVGVALGLGLRIGLRIAGRVRVRVGRVIKVRVIRARVRIRPQSTLRYPRASLLTSVANIAALSLIVSVRVRIHGIIRIANMG